MAGLLAIPTIHGRGGAVRRQSRFPPICTKASAHPRLHALLRPASTLHAETQPPRPTCAAPRHSRAHRPPACARATPAARDAASAAAETPPRRPCTPACVRRVTSLAVGRARWRSTVTYHCTCLRPMALLIRSAFWRALLRVRRCSITQPRPTMLSTVSAMAHVSDARQGRRGLIDGADADALADSHAACLSALGEGTY